MSLGDAIRTARENANLTQGELGKLCGITKQTIYKYESGVITNIPLDRLEKIAAVLNVSPSILLGWDEWNELDSKKCLADNFSEARREMFALIDSLSDEQVSTLLQIANAALHL